MKEIKKAIILTGGYGTRYLPLSKVIPKDFFPLVDKPMIYYIFEEVKNSNIEEVIIINRPQNRMLMDYLMKDYALDNFLKQKNQIDDINQLEQIESFVQEIKVTYIIETNREPKGDGHGVLQAKKVVGDEPCAVLFSDDIVYAKQPCLAQLMEIYQEYKVPVIGIHQLPIEKISGYGVIDGQKQRENNRVYKINRFVEKPSATEAPSNLAVIGKYIITPEVFDELEKVKIDANRDVIRLAWAFQDLVSQNKTVLGYQFKGDWLECGNKLLWMKSNLYLLLKHPQYNQEIKKYLKEIID